MLPLLSPDVPANFMLSFIHFYLCWSSLMSLANVISKHTLKVLAIKDIIFEKDMHINI